MELLIAIGIIAVLLALLLPALSVARESAWRAQMRIESKSASYQ